MSEETNIVTWRELDRAGCAYGQFTAATQERCEAANHELLKEMKAQVDKLLWLGIGLLTTFATAAITFVFVGLKGLL